MIPNSEPVYHCFHREKQQTQSAQESSLHLLVYSCEAIMLVGFKLRCSHVGRKEYVITYFIMNSDKILQVELEPKMIIIIINEFKQLETI